MYGVCEIGRISAVATLTMPFSWQLRFTAVVTGGPLQFCAHKGERDKK